MGPKREKVDEIREREQWAEFDELYDSEINDEELTRYRFGVG